MTHQDDNILVFVLAFSPVSFGYIEYHACVTIAGPDPG